MTARRVSSLGLIAMMLAASMGAAPSASSTPPFFVASSEHGAWNALLIEVSHRVDVELQLVLTGGTGRWAGLFVSQGDFARGHIGSTGSLDGHLLEASATVPGDGRSFRLGAQSDSTNSNTLVIRGLHPGQYVLLGMSGGPIDQATFTVTVSDASAVTILNATDGATRYLRPYGSPAVVGVGATVIGGAGAGVIDHTFSIQHALVGWFGGLLPGRIPAAEACDLTHESQAWACPSRIGFGGPGGYGPAGDYRLTWAGAKADLPVGRIVAIWADVRLPGMP